MSGSDDRILLTCEISRKIWFLVYGDEEKDAGTNVWGMLKYVVGVSVVEGSVLRFGGV